MTPFAIATGSAERDPTSDLSGALVTPTVMHRATLRPAPLLFVGLGEFRKAERIEFNPPIAERQPIRIPWLFLQKEPSQGLSEDGCKTITRNEGKLNYNVETRTNISPTETLIAVQLEGSSLL